MKPSRRSFLKATAALPAVAAVATAPAVEAMAAAVPPPLEPAYPWQWWLSLDGGEVYCEVFDTRDQALHAALQYEGGTIAECQQGDFYLDLDGGTIIEALYGQNEDRVNEDNDFIECTPEQERELGDMVSAAIEQWVRKHNIKTTAWIFDGIRNRETIEIPAAVTE